MAIGSCLSTRFIVYQPVLVRKLGFGLVIHREVRVPVKKTVRLQIRSSMRDQFFEDHSNGIICYEDNSGELVCEGFDEGPRFVQQYPSTAYSLRDASILDLLPQRWLQILDGEAANGDASAMVDEHTCNGFNALH